MRKNKPGDHRLHILAAFCIVSLCAMPVRAARVVSLMPSYTEIIFELGAGPELVGTSTFCDWPPAARALGKVGDYLRPNLEMIISLKPDVVFAGVWRGSSVAQDLRNSGVKVIELPEERNIGDIFRTIGLIAAKLDRKKEGEKLVKKMKSDLKSPVYGARRPSVYLEIDEGGWTAGELSFLTDAVEKAGGRNIFSAEKKNYFQVSWEAVVRKAPDAVILLAGSAADFERRPLAAGLKAVKNARVFTGLDRDAFSRPGPRLAAEIRKLKNWLHESDKH